MEKIIESRQIKKLEKTGKLKIITKYQISSIEGDKNIKSITIKNEEENAIQKKAHKKNWQSSFLY